jgi:hypothetical protein
VGIADRKLVAVILGFTGLLSLLGLIGAWLRLAFDRRTLFAHPFLRAVIIVMLVAGVIGTNAGFLYLMDGSGLVAAGLASAVGSLFIVVSLRPRTRVITTGTLPGPEA